MTTPKFSAYFESTLAYVRLVAAQSDASSDSEREEIAADIRALREKSIPVSILAAACEIQSRHPILIPVVIAGIFIKMAF